MDHLTAGRLVDFARGLLIGQERVSAEGHVRDCQECRSAVGLFRRVHESARSAVVPPELVDAAKALYLPPARQASTVLRRVIARLVPAESWGLALADVRSVVPTASHFMYRWNDYFMDLRVEREPDSVSRSLLGQIANGRTPDTPVGGVPVTLMAAARVIAETRCNALGEFCIDFVPLKGMRVRFDVLEAEVSIDVPLDQLKIQPI